MRTWGLTAAQRRALERELARARDAALFRRILALLEVDAGCPVGEVAQRLRVDRRSVQRWIGRYRHQSHIEALRHQPGQGRPRRWDQTLEARLEVALSQRPTDLGYVGTGWTVPLLQQWLASDRPWAALVGGHPPAPAPGTRLCMEALPLRAAPRPAAREKNAGFAAKFGP
jgi:transposase